MIDNQNHSRGAEVCLAYFADKLGVERVKFMPGSEVYAYGPIPNTTGGFGWYFVGYKRELIAQWQAEKAKLEASK